MNLQALPECTAILCTLGCAPCTACDVHCLESKPVRTAVCTCEWYTGPRAIAACTVPHIAAWSTRLPPVATSWPLALPETAMSSKEHLVRVQRPKKIMALHRQQQCTTGLLECVQCQHKDAPAGITRCEQTVPLSDSYLEAARAAFTLYTSPFSLSVAR